jgi:hypothetical protein
MKQKKELGIECPKIESVEIVNAGDGTPLAEVGKEIAEQAKEKSKKASKKKAEKRPKDEKSSEPVADSFAEVLSVLDKNTEYRYTTGRSNIVIYRDDEKVAVVYKRKYKVRFYVAPEVFEKIKSSSELYEGQGVGNYRVFKISLFVKTANIETAFNKMFK